MIVLAVDPGLASGVALINTQGAGDLCELMSSAELEPIATEDTVLSVIETYRDFDLHVVVERFTITVDTAKKSPSPWSLELIGSIKYICRMNGLPVPTLQTPADAKSFAPNPRLKNLGLWHKGGHGHALDAIRHGVLYMVKNGYRDKRLISE